MGWGSAGGAKAEGAGSDWAEATGAERGMAEVEGRAMEEGAGSGSEGAGWGWAEEEEGRGRSCRP